MKVFRIVLALPFFILFLTSCQKEFEPDFTMNGSEYANFAVPPSDYDAVRDSVLTINLGDTVTFLTTEIKGIKTWQWSVNNNAVSAPKSGFISPFSKKSGFHAIRLCVNNKDDQCITKYIYVKEVRPEIESVLPPSPEITITNPPRSPENVKSSNVKVQGTVSNLLDAVHLTVLLNKTIPQTLESYNNETGEFEVHVTPLENGMNTISIIASNARDTVTHDLIIKAKTGRKDPTIGGGGDPVISIHKKPKEEIKPPVVEDRTPTPVTTKPLPVLKNLVNTGIAGMNLDKYDKNCGTLQVYDFTTTITPTRDVELLSFVVISDVCGGLTLTITGDGRTEKISRGLTAGQSGQSVISLGDLDLRLKAGKTYTLKGSTLKDFAGCSNPNRPKLLNATSCGSPRAPAEVKMNYSGNKVLFDIKYLF
ncbi:MAG: hypothetical protein ABI761_06530 [Saprospiraceae bacterium]